MGSVVYWYVEPEIRQALRQATGRIAAPTPVRQESAKSYGQQGYGHYQKDDYDQAIADYTRALEIDPKFGKAYDGRARVHFEKKEYDKAWEDMRQAQNLGCEVNPKFLQELRQASGREK